MLTEWTLSNFKSFRQKTIIDLAPITLFVGANSSGKSTIIQSLLLIKQTLEYAAPNRALALNGPLLKIGTFRDLRSSSATEDTVGLSWKMTCEDMSRRRPSGNFMPYGGFYQGYYLGGPIPTSIECDLQYRVTEHSANTPSAYGSDSVVGELAELNPSLSGVSFCYSKTNPAEQVTRAQIVLKRAEPPILVTDEGTLDDLGPKPITAQFGYAVGSITPDIKLDLEEWLEVRERTHVVGANVQHFFLSKSACSTTKEVMK
jgi:hypothetical protein